MLSPRRSRLVGVLIAAAFGGMLLSSEAAVAASPGCTLNPTNGTVTRTVGTRTYNVRVPQGLTGTQVPLLLSLHGASSNAETDETFTGWSGFADRNNFIVAYPQALPPGAGFWAIYEGSYDVTYLRQVVDDISATWCVDPRHVHADGWSNGAIMTQRLACDAANKFASVTAYAGAHPTSATGTPCRPSRPISVGLFVGDLDPAVVSSAEARDRWVASNSCSTPPTRTTDTYGTLEDFSCASGTEVWYRVVRNQFHDWPSGAKGEDQRKRMWSFFQANPLP